MHAIPYLKVFAVKLHKIHRNILDHMSDNNNASWTWCQWPLYREEIHKKEGIRQKQWQWCGTGGPFN